MKETLYFNTIDELVKLISNPKLLFKHSEKSHDILESSIANEPIGSFEFIIADGSKILFNYYESTRDFYKIKIINKNNQIVSDIHHHTLCLGFDEYRDDSTGEVESEYNENDPKYLQGWIEFIPDIRREKIKNSIIIHPVFSIHFEKFYFTKG